MTATIIRGDARHLPLADESVDLVCTSPPYFALRSYQDGGEHYEGQIGDEATPTEFLDALLEVTAECVRVLKPSGSIFVNLGDKYVADNRGSAFDPKRGAAKHAPRGPAGFPTGGMRQKSLMLIPERYRIRCVDELGLIARAVIVWDKPNGLPESVTDRVRRSHEDWVHLTKRPRYYSAVDEIREEHAPQSLARAGRNRFAPDLSQTGVASPNTLDPADSCNPLGKLPGSVWRIATEPLNVPEHLGVDHFAAFPTEWPRRIIQGWSPSGVCADCGFLLGSSYDYGMFGVPPGLRAARPQGPAEDVLQQGMRESIHGAEPGDHEGVDSDQQGLHRSPRTGSSDGGPDWLRDATPDADGRSDWSGSAAVRGGTSPERDQGRQQAGEPRTAGESRPRQDLRRDAAVRDRVPVLRAPGAGTGVCPHCDSASIRQSLILDCFGGTGTTALVATALGRHGISVDMSADYCRLAEWRTTDPKQLAKAARRPYVEPREQVDGQEAFQFEEESA